jgi:AcrR family transcriptional regulator
MMPKGPTKRRPQTTAALLDAAYEVFAERGFHGSSIGEICERAGLTTGAFYSNYTSKDELFFALFDRHGQRLVHRFAEFISDALDADDPLTALLDLLAELNDYDPRWYLVSTEYTLHAIRNPETAKLLAEHDKQLRDELTGLLRLLLKKSGHHTDVNLDMLARLVVAIHEGGLAQSLVEPDALLSGELERTYLPTVLRAVFRSGDVVRAYPTTATVGSDSSA